MKRRYFQYTYTHLPGPAIRQLVDDVLARDHARPQRRKQPAQVAGACGAVGLEKPYVTFDIVVKDTVSEQFARDLADQLIRDLRIGADPVKVELWDPAKGPKYQRSN